MSEFITKYQQLQSVKLQLKALRKKADVDRFVLLLAEKLELSDWLKENRKDFKYKIDGLFKNL